MPRNFCSNRVNLMKQFILSVMAIFAAIAIWVMYVPAAGPFLARVGVYDLIGLEPPPTEQNRAGGFGGGASRVIASEVTTGPVNSLVSAIGDGRAAQTVTIRSATSGIIRDMPVAPGTYVEAGALVAQFDDAAERIALERARLLVADANDEVDRLRQLGSSGSVAGATIRAAELALRTAELEVKQAEFDLEQRRITAPIGGWLGLLDAARGDRVGAQEPIAVITDRSSLQIEFRVPVTIRQRTSDKVIVEGGLSPGDLVVIEGVQTLRPGAPVDVVTNDAASLWQSMRGTTIRKS